MVRPALVAGLFFPPGGTPLRPLDIAVIVLYCVAVMVVGLLLAGRQRDASDYFLGHRGLPWWALMLSIVATETSAVTVISVPGIAARGNLTFLQIAFGYLVGRIGVAALLLPGYFEGTQDTAYQRLERRFGAASPAHRVRRLPRHARARRLRPHLRHRDSARDHHAVEHPAGILAIGMVTLVYTWVGGLRAVVWVDVIQLGVYLLGGVATLIVATHLAGGMTRSARAWDAGKLRRSISVRRSRCSTRSGAAWSGGALLSAASHGTDHLIVQRLLAARSSRTRSAR